jgi:hypothetical protein
LILRDVRDVFLETSPARHSLSILARSAENKLPKRTPCAARKRGAPREQRKKEKGAFVFPREQFAH